MCEKPRLKSEAQKSAKDSEARDFSRGRFTAFDILEKGEIRTYRKDDRQELLAIRNGAYMLDDGMFRPEFFEMVTALENRLKKAAEGTSLPERPDMEKIEDLMVAVNEAAVKAG